MMGSDTTGIFVGINNTIYVAESSKNCFQVWLKNGVHLIRNVSGNLDNPKAVFAAINGDIYVDNGDSHQRVDKWTLNVTSSVMVMNVSESCYGLFVDLNNSLYCSMKDQHQVVKISLGINGISPSIAAGTGNPGNGTTVAGLSGNISLDRPTDVIFDADGVFIYCGFE